MAGIGCHYMAVWMPDRDTATFTQMGGEGVTWIGQAPFTDEQARLPESRRRHLLSIPACWRSAPAIAAGVNITYKILYNDAVAMTGGQPVEGGSRVAADHAPGRGRGRRAASSSSPTSPTNIRRHRLRAGRDGPSPRRARRGAARAARDHGRLGPDLRPDLRHRKAPPPQARARSRSAQARLHQRPGLRGLRRLLACSRTASRSSRSRPSSAASARSTSRAATRIFPASKGFCPSFVTVAWRHARSAKNARRSIPAQLSPTCRCRRRRRSTSRTTSCHRHRRHRRHHRRRAARHGRASRGQGLLGARLHRPRAEERRGDEPRPPRDRAGGLSSRAHRRRRRRPAARLRHGGGGRPTALSRIEHGVTRLSSTPICSRPPAS